jgi:aspartate kinase
MATNIAGLRARHEAVCRELLPGPRQPSTMAEIHRLIAEFERIASGMAMLNIQPLRSVDESLSVGERLSALLMSEYIASEGVAAMVVDASGVIVTNAVFGNASPLMEPTRAKARERLLPLLEQGVLPVITGFNGTPLSDAAARIFPPPFSPPRWMPPSCGSGPTWTAS